MRLALLLASLAALLHQAQPQRSWWAGGARRRRHHSEQGDRRELRTHRYSRQGEEHGYNNRGQGEDSRVSSLQRRRLQRQEAGSEQRHHDRGYRDTGYGGYRGYYPTPAPANTSHLLEATEEYKVETRNGDTVIQFARSGDTQGGFLYLKHPANISFFEVYLYRLFQPI